MPLTINFLEDYENIYFTETVFQRKIPLLDKNLTQARDKKAGETLIFFSFRRSRSKLDFTILWKIFPNADPIASVIEKYKVQNTFPCRVFPSEAVDMIKFLKKLKTSVHLKLEKKVKENTNWFPTFIFLTILSWISLMD